MSSHSKLQTVCLLTLGISPYKIDLLPYTTEEAGGFVGCTIGVYTSSNGTATDNHCDVKYLKVEY